MTLARTNIEEDFCLYKTKAWSTLVAQNKL